MVVRSAAGAGLVWGPAHNLLAAGGLRLQPHIVKRLNIYQNEFYHLLSIYASEQTSFELSEFITIDRRTKTADGSIWYRVSLSGKDAEKITNIGHSISQWQDKYFESYLESIGDPNYTPAPTIDAEEETLKTEEALRGMDEKLQSE